MVGERERNFELCLISNCPPNCPIYTHPPFESEGGRPSDNMNHFFILIMVRKEYILYFEILFTNLNYWVKIIILYGIRALIIKR
jgi:hypothetical protein